MNHNLILAVSLLLAWSIFASANAQPDPWKYIKEKNRPAIVFLRSVYRLKNGLEQPVEGTGFLVDSKGYIVTCEHVVSKDLKIGEETLKDAKLLGTTASIGGRGEFPRQLHVTDRDRDNDLALLLLKDEPSVPLQSVKIDLDSDLDSAGELYALGFAEANPGSLDGVRGYVRSRFVESWLMSNPINPGQSGGPVFSKEGRVLGVSRGALPNSNQMNVVIPIRLLINQLNKIGVKPNGNGEPRPIIVLIGSAVDYTPKDPLAPFKGTSVQLLHEQLENFDVREFTVSYASNTWKNILKMRPAPEVILMHASAFHDDKRADEAVSKFQVIVSKFHEFMPNTKLVVFSRRPRANPSPDLCQRWKRQVDFLTSDKFGDRLLFYPLPRLESDFSGAAGLQVVQIVRCLSGMNANAYCSTYLHDRLNEAQRRIADTSCSSY